MSGAYDPNLSAGGFKTPRLTARERSRRRKAIYAVAIIVLIVILFSLGYPSTSPTETTKGQVGGVLAQFRDKNELSQSELGEIDPTSETVHLATLGMRGVGASLLWWTASQQQMKKDWTQLRATLDEISKFQPHSVQVWKFQAWNLSYNVSVAFDDYHDKFYWVIEGLNFMHKGIELNPQEPRLYWDMGWFISNKIGRADEAKYYRRLFSGKRDVSASMADFRNDSARRDDAGRDFAPDYVKEFREHYRPPTGFPQGSDILDNWHVGKAWFLAAESKINPPRYPVHGMADVIFYSDAPTCQFYYADNLEKDGRFDQVAVNAWRQATREWDAFADKYIDSSYDVKLRLDDKEPLLAAVEKEVKELDTLAPGARAEVAKRLKDALKPDERAAWDTPSERTVQQNNLVATCGEKMIVKDRAVADLAPPANSKKADELARKIEEQQTKAQWITRQRSTVNFDFWRCRAATEQTDDCVAARKAIHDGDEAFAKGDQIRAKPLYEKGLVLSREVLDPNQPEKYRLLVKEDVNLRSDLMDVIRRYQKCLDQDDQDLPEPFILQDIIEENKQHGGGQ